MMYKKGFWTIVGWILFVWGILGILVEAYTATALGTFDTWNTDAVMSILRFVFSIIFIWGGWSLAHRKISR